MGNPKMFALHRLRKAFEKRVLATAENTVWKRRIRQEFDNARWESSHALGKLANPPELTAEERRAVEAFWGPYAAKVGLRSFDWPGYRLLKALGVFRPEAVMRDLFEPWIIRSLNPAKYVHALNSKLAMFLYFDALPRPVTHLVKFEDGYLDGKKRPVDEREAAGILAGLDSFLIKPLFCFGGHGVRKIHQEEADAPARRAQAEELLREYPDFIVQTIIRQHPGLAELNPSSVNTVRMNTLSLNGKTTVCYSCARCGKPGSQVDNLSSGGSWLDLDAEGRFTGKAIDKTLRMQDCAPNGLPLAGRSVPHFDRLAGLATAMHPRLFPMFHLAGWDLSIDEHGEPIVLEVNFRRPETFTAQLLRGPFFGERTQEVIDYALAHPFRSYTDELPH